MTTRQGRKKPKNRYKKKEHSLKIMMDGNQGVLTDNDKFSLVINGEMMPQMEKSIYNVLLVKEVLKKTGIMSDEELEELKGKVQNQITKMQEGTAER